MKSETFQRASFLLLLSSLSILFIWMIKDFIVALFFGAVLTYMCNWFYEWLLKKTKGKTGLSASLTIVAFIIVVGIPLVSLLVTLGNQVIHVSEIATDVVQDLPAQKEKVNNLLEKVPFYEQLEPYKKLAFSKAGNLASAGGKLALRYLSALTAGTLTFLLNALVTFYAMFFFLIEGDAMLKRIFYLLPLEDKDEMALLQRFQSMTRATIKGTFVIAIVQGSLAGIALWFAGIPSALFWSTVMAGLSLLPTFGSALVWVPACIYLFSTGEVTKAVLVFAFCSLVVGTIDNFIRPVLIGKDTEMHQLMVLLGTLGGLAMFGLPGFLIGPILASLFVTAWDIFGTMFKEFLPKVKTSPSHLQ